MLPATLKPGDSLIISTCFAPMDEAMQTDTIVVTTDCYNTTIPLTGKVLNSSVSENAIRQPMFNVTPNPLSDNFITLTFSSPLDSKSTITINDILGREVYRTAINQGIPQVKVLLPNLDGGIYYVRLKTGNYTASQKLEIMR